MSLSKTFKMNTAVEKEGVWLEYGENSKGAPIRIRVARAGGSNMKYARVLEAKTRPYRRQLQNETMDKDLEQKLFIEVYAESVVVAWENVEDDWTNPALPTALPFSKENVVRLFTELPELFTDVREQAMKAALYRADLRESDAGN